MPSANQRIPTTIVVAMSKNGVIGRQNQLPWKLSSDLQRFKRLTMGQTLIMGRKTFESIGKPLPGRTTIVLTRAGLDPTIGQRFPEIRSAETLEDAIDQVVPGSSPYIVGGAEIYSLAVSTVDQMMITRVLADIEGDAYFPDWDKSQWKLTFSEPLPAGPKDEWPTEFEIWNRR